MKQKITVKAVIKYGDKVLLLRRHGGRPSIAGLYELPGGRVHMGQQPEDAIAHALRIHAGVGPETVQLRDTMSFIDPDDRELQYVFIVFDASLKPTDKTIELSSEYDKYTWKKLSDIQRNETTQSTLQILGLQQIAYVSDQESLHTTTSDDKKSTNLSSVIIYSDGGSRGNPGPSASGFVVQDEKGEIVAEGGEYLGIATNNVAEYKAVYAGLLKARELGVSHVDFRVDSQLVANQMNGIYKIKHPDLAVIHHSIKELIPDFEKVTFSHVRREYNKLADGVVNRILDENAT